MNRFGKLPKEVEDLFEIVKVRWKAQNLGFEKLTWKNNILKGYFVSSKHVEYYQTEKFGRILDYVKVHPKRCTLKQVKERLILSVQNADSIEKLDVFFESINEHIDKKK